MNYLFIQLNQYVKVTVFHEIDFKSFDILGYG